MANLTLHIDLTQLKSLETSLINISKGMNISAKNLGSTISKNVGSAEKSVTKFNSMLSRMSFVMTATFSYKAYSTFINFLSDAVEETKLLEDSFDEIKSLLTSLGDEGDKLAKEFLKEAPDLAVKYARNLKDVTEGIYDTVSAGRVGADAMDAFEASAKLAAVTNADLDTTVKVVNRTLNAYGLSGEKAGEVSETLFKIIQKGMTRMDELERPFGKLVGTAGALGVDLRKISADFAVIVRQLPSREAATALTRAFSKLAEIPVFSERIKEGGLLEVVKILNQLPDTKVSELVGSERPIKAVRAELNDLEKALGGYNYFLEDTNHLNEEFADKTDNASFILGQEEQQLKKNARVLGRELVPLQIEFYKAISIILKPVSKLIELSSKLDKKMGTLGRAVRFALLQFGDVKGAFEFIIKPMSELSNKLFDAVFATEKLTDANQNLKKSFENLGIDKDGVASQTFDMISAEISALVNKQGNFLKGGIIIGQEPTEYIEITERITLLRQAYNQLYDAVSGGIEVPEDGLRGLLEILGYIEPSVEKTSSANSVLVDSLKNLETELSKTVREYEQYQELLKLGKGEETGFNDRMEVATKNLSKMWGKIDELKKQGADSEVIFQWLDIYIDLSKDLGKEVEKNKVGDLFKQYRAEYETTTNLLRKGVLKKLIEGLFEQRFDEGDFVGALPIKKWLDSLKDDSELTEFEKAMKRVSYLLKENEIELDENSASLGRNAESLGKTNGAIVAHIDELKNMKNAGNLTKEEVQELEEAILRLQSVVSGKSQFDDLVKKIISEISGIQVVAQEITSAVSNIWSGFWDFQRSNLESYYERKFDLLEKEQELAEEAVNQSILTEEHRNNALSALNRKYADETAELQAKKAKKMAKLEKKKALFDLAINYASGMMNVWTVKPIVLAPVFSGILTALYGAQLALMNSTKFAKGGILKGASHSQGGIPIGSGQEVEGGEAVINKKSTAMFAPILGFLNKLGGGVDFSGARLSMPKMASGGIVSDTGVSNKMFLQMIQAVQSFQPVVLSGISDREIYRASMSGRPRGAF